jgi:hypothetical protein
MERNLMINPLRIAISESEGSAHGSLGEVSQHRVLLRQGVLGFDIHPKASFAQQFHYPAGHLAHEGIQFAHGRLGQLEEGWLAKGIQHV